MFGFARQPDPRDISPQALHALLQAGDVVVVDVREPHEFAAAHIPGAVNLPLSRFDPGDLPDPGGRRLVLSCAAGGRSARAMAACESARAAVDGHLAGGLGAWAGAGFPVVQGA